MTVAVLIPTRNRADFVERTLRYYDSLKSEHPIYIGDASDAATAARLQAFIQTLEHAKVRYFHWEGVRAKETTVELAKCAQAESRYCALHGDDDYFVPSSLDKCAEFLSANPDYRTVQGRAALFTLDRPGPYGALHSVGDYWGVHALEQESSADRLAAFAGDYFIAAFSTHRTDEFVRDSEYYASVKDDGFGELLHCYTMAIKGKSKFLDCLYLVRHAHPGMSHPGAVDWIVQEHWSADYHKTVDVIGRALAETSGLPQNEAYRIASDVMKAYVKRVLAGKVGSVDRNFVSTVKRMLPASLKRAVRRLVSPPIDVRDMALLAKQTSCFHDEFLPVARSFIGPPAKAVEGIP